MLALAAFWKLVTASLCALKQTSSTKHQGLVSPRKMATLICLVEVQDFCLSFHLQTTTEAAKFLGCSQDIAAWILRIGLSI